MSRLDRERDISSLGTLVQWVVTAIVASVLQALVRPPHRSAREEAKMEVGAERVWRSRLAEEREQAVGLPFRLVQGRNPPSSHRLLHLSVPVLVLELKLAPMRKPVSMRFLSVLEQPLKDLAGQLAVKPFQPPLVEQAMVDHVHRQILGLRRHLQLVLLIAKSDQIPSSQARSSLFLAHSV
jgi:hypothetical protein